MTRLNDVVSDVLAELDRRVGEFYLAKSRLNRLAQIVGALKGKIPTLMFDEYSGDITQLRTDAVGIEGRLSALSAEKSKANPNYIALAGGALVFSDMDGFISRITGLEKTVEGDAKGAGVSIEPGSWISVVVLGSSIAFLLYQAIKGAKKR